MTDTRQLKLGKLEPSRKPTDLLLSTFFDHELILPTVPDRFGFGRYLPWKMLGNGPDDEVYPGFAGAGDCVLAGAVEETRIWTAARHGLEAPFTGREAIEAYSELTGYVVGDESTDYGTNMSSAASWRLHTGIADVAGQRHKIAAYAKLEVANWDQARAAAYVFGAIGVGIEFPASAWDQFDSGADWDYVSRSPIQGRHYIPGVGSVSRDELTIVTWAERVQVTRQFYEAYNDEGIVYFSDEVIRPDGHGLHGFDRDEFLRQLAAVA